MKQIWIGILQALIGFCAPIYMLFLVWFAKYDTEPSYVTDDGPIPSDSTFCIRGDMPGWLKWTQTMDSRLNGYYEATMLRYYGNGSYLRRQFCTYMWLGHRNRAQGLAAKWGKKAIGFIPNPFSDDPNESKEFWTKTDKGWEFYRAEDDVYRKFKKLAGNYYWAWGYEVYRLRDGTFWAVNQITIKKM